jgi:hypothetical protein
MKSMQQQLWNTGTLSAFACMKVAVEKKKNLFAYRHGRYQPTN